MFVSFLFRILDSNLSRINVTYFQISADPSLVLTCVDAGVLLHAPLADETLLAVLALELLGDVMQRPVHLQAVFVGERLAAHLAGVRPHAGVIQHVDPQRVQLRQRLPADVAHKLPLGVRRHGPVLQVGVHVPLGALRRRRFADGRPLAALLLVSGQVGAQGGGVLELLATQLQQQTREQRPSGRLHHGENQTHRAGGYLRCTCSREPSRALTCA